MTGAQPAILVCKFFHLAALRTRTVFNVRRNDDSALEHAIARECAKVYRCYECCFPTALISTALPFFNTLREVSLYGVVLARFGAWPVSDSIKVLKMVDIEEYNHSVMPPPGSMPALESIHLENVRCHEDDMLAFLKQYAYLKKLTLVAMDDPLAAASIAGLEEVDVRACSSYGGRGHRAGSSLQRMTIFLDNGKSDIYSKVSTEDALALADFLAGGVSDLRLHHTDWAFGERMLADTRVIADVFSRELPGGVPGVLSFRTKAWRLEDLAAFPKLETLTIDLPRRFSLGPELLAVCPHLVTLNVNVPTTTCIEDIRFVQDVLTGLLGTVGCPRVHLSFTFDPDVLEDFEEDGPHTGMRPDPGTLGVLQSVCASGVASVSLGKNLFGVDIVSALRRDCRTDLRLV
jgi:hypothetical protein